MTADALPGPTPDETRRLLRWVTWVAIADTVLLVVLVIAAVQDSGLVSILGPIHGVGFVIELLLAAKGAGERMWGWWFPAAVLVTGGPLGALIGHVKVTRDLERARALQAAPAAAG